MRERFASIWRERFFVFFSFFGRGVCGRQRDAGGGKGWLEQVIGALSGARDGENAYGDLPVDRVDENGRVSYKRKASLGRSSEVYLA